MSRGRLSSRLERALERLPSPGSPAGGRILLLGTAREAIEPLRARAFDPVAVEDPAAFPFAEASADAALVVDALERHEWDRWLLQRLHRAVRPGGPLVLTAENLLALAGPADLASWAATARKQLRLRLVPRAAAPPFRRRRYRAGMLREMLAALGWAIESWDDEGPGLLGLGGRALTPGFVVAARRVASLPGLDASRPFADPAVERRRFEARHAGFFAARDRWTAAHPGAVGAPPAPLDLERCRGRSVLVLAPHPDDELIGCGGTLLRLRDAGASVTVIQATDGADAASLLRAPPDVRRAVRLDEARTVAAAAGFAGMIAWGEPNEAFHASDALADRLRRTLEELRPALVFVPFVTDVHPDHVTCARLLARALAGAAEPAGATGDAVVASYEVWGLVPANAYCDVTTAMAEQERLLWLYETAMKVDDYVHFCAERNHYNALSIGGPGGYAEAFHVAPARRFVDLVAPRENAR